MALFNYASKEIILKVVYYGPGLSGKTTNLQHLHTTLPSEQKGKLLSLSTEADRTLFFDFLPVALGKIRDFTVRFQLYTVPGQVRYNATRKLVLKGADAVVFVADSQREMREQNIESFQNMRENLAANNIDPDSIPLVLQYNKRDLGNILLAEELDKDLNSNHFQAIPAVAITGKGVEETFQSITKLMLKHVSQKHKVDIKPLQAEEAVEREFVPERSSAEEPSFPAGSELSVSSEMTDRVLKKQISPREDKVHAALKGDSLRLMEGLLEATRTLNTAVSEISKGMRDGQMEVLLKDLAAASSAMNNSMSELLKELRDARAQQKEMLKALLSIEKTFFDAASKKRFRLF
jgi:signal recognition particle receptor subunit beta